MPNRTHAFKFCFELNTAVSSKTIVPSLKLSFQSHFLEKICKFFAVLVYSLYFNAKFILNLYLPKCFFRRRIFSLILSLSIAHEYSLVLTVLLRNVLGHLHHATSRLSLPLPPLSLSCALLSCFLYRLRRLGPVILSSWIPPVAVHFFLVLSFSIFICHLLSLTLCLPSDFHMSLSSCHSVFSTFLNLSAWEMKKKHIHCQTSQSCHEIEFFYLWRHRSPDRSKHLYQTRVAQSNFKLQFK